MILAPEELNNKDVLMVPTSQLRRRAWSSCGPARSHTAQGPRPSVVLEALPYHGALHFLPMLPLHPRIPTLPRPLLSETGL